MASDSGEVEVERELDCSAEEAWGMVSDVTRMGEWSPETARCRWLRGATGPEPGARFKGTNRKGRLVWSTTCTVTDSQPGEVFAFEVTAGPLKVSRWEYRFEAVDGGRCRVTERWVDRRTAAMARITAVVTRVSDRADYNRAQMDQTLARLAAAAGGQSQV